MRFMAANVFPGKSHTFKMKQTNKKIKKIKRNSETPYR